MPNAVICLPTYNERENLEAMLRALAPLGVGVLVVDDSSPTAPARSLTVWRRS